MKNISPRELKLPQNKKRTYAEQKNKKRTYAEQKYWQIAKKWYTKPCNAVIAEQVWQKTPFQRIDAKGWKRHKKRFAEYRLLSIENTIKS